ncbi:MAG: GHKL domain-containing protein [Ruminococcus sp.]|nr:GHKL domain-containing protein [Ruminococcus sp.]
MYYNQLCASFIETVLLLLLFLYVRKKSTALIMYSKIRRIPVRIYIAIMIFIVLMEIVLEALRNENMLSYGKYAAWPLIVVMGYIVISLMQISISDTEQREIVELLDTQLKNQTNYYEKINDIYSEFRSFRHDFKNHLICLRSLLADGDTDKALAYMSDIESISYTEKHRYETGNVIADALLNDKAERAEQYNVKINFSGFIPTMGITDVDICTLMSNSIDNAIEACAKDSSDNMKEVTVTSDFRQGCFFFTVRNPIFEKVRIEKNNKIRTTKEDKIIHGYGLSNIIRVSKKYHGDTTVCADNNEFILESHLFLEKDI